MTAENIFLERLIVELLALRVEAREPLGIVRDVDAAIAGALESAKDARASRGALETNIKVRLERPRRFLVFQSFGYSECAVRLGYALVLVRKAELGEGAAGNEEAGRVGYVTAIEHRQMLRFAQTRRQSSWLGHG